MDMYLDPSIYKLHSRVILKTLAQNHIALVKKRKTRIIMKDGLQILEQIAQIKQKQPDLKVSLLISGPICNKTIQLLTEHKIEIITET